MDWRSVVSCDAGGSVVCDATRRCQWSGVKVVVNVEEWTRRRASKLRVRRKVRSCGAQTTGKVGGTVKEGATKV
jgi:hypothetical protein